MTLPNNPYARPINATQPHHAAVIGLYGRPATDKARSVAAGPNDATQLRALPSVVPHWPDPIYKNEAKAPRKQRAKKEATPNPEPTSPSPDVSSPSDAQSTVTEDDLFG